MPTFNVTVLRYDTRRKTFRIVAEDDESACEEALAQSSDFDWHQTANPDGECEVADCQEIENANLQD